MDKKCANLYTIKIWTERKSGREEEERTKVEKEKMIVRPNGGIWRRGKKAVTAKGNEIKMRKGARGRQASDTGIC